MLSFLWTIPAFPIAGFLLLALFGARMGRQFAAIIGAGSIGLAFAATLKVGAWFTLFPPDGHAYTQTLWTWMSVGAFQPTVAFHLDALSLLMLLVVTGVGFLIHVYAIEYMIDDASFARFFASMNLFVGAMIVLVLADDLLLLYLGWEGVGLCSYLLIGFWYQDPANCRAANKAFLTTRIGDVALAIGLFLLFTQAGTLNIQSLLDTAQHDWVKNSSVATLAALLLLGGAIGKSGQMPLQVWLPDAMAGPTPVSALIHAATMVTAGVYLIARMHGVFLMAPDVMQLVATLGAATMLVAGLAALAQRDIKRVLAYSTVSQIGYMFLALGVGAWSAAMFHFMTHAFFKALLFMSAGWIIVSCHHEQDMFKMGGLRKQLPTAFWTMLVGSLSLAAVPFISSGFYSKDLILWEVWSSGDEGKFLWYFGITGAFITALYTTRMMVLVFFGKPHAHRTPQPGNFMRVPLVVLAILATVGGLVNLPGTMGHFTPFTGFLSTALPVAGHHGDVADEARLQWIALFVVSGGIAAGLLLYGPLRKLTDGLAGSPLGRPVRAFLASGLGFDAVYDALLIWPYRAIAAVLRGDAFNGIYGTVTLLALAGNRTLGQTQNGKLRWYVMGVALGAVVTIAVAVLL
jgi:NADH-quinone oxidoreductase subunit L